MLLKMFKTVILGLLILASIQCKSVMAGKSHHYGGDGGNAFSDNYGDEDRGQQVIQSIQIRHGSRIDGIGLNQRNWHGGKGGGIVSIDTSNICITHVKVRAGSMVDSIQFFGYYRSSRTHRWASPKFGGNGGTEFSAAWYGSCLTGYEGRSGGFLDQIKFIYH